MVSELRGRMLVLGAGSRSDAAVQQMCGMFQHGRCGRSMEQGKAHLVSTVVAVARLGPGGSGRVAELLRWRQRSFVFSYLFVFS